MLPHPVNWYFGWSLVLSAFVTGAAIGLFFHRDAFLGGYASFRRRLVRLGHIAQAALGMMNVLYGLSPGPPSPDWRQSVASAGLVVGAVAMPAVCFLTAWREPFRHLFFIPVASLMGAVLCALFGVGP
jgi:hypothetical protein